jgi:hypothetical protein
MSFAAKLLNMGANSPYLNPYNDDQNIINTSLGKPVRFIGRAVWGSGSCSIGAVCGIAYHGFALLKLIYQNVDKGRVIQKFLHHKEALMDDVLALNTVVFPLISFLTYSSFIRFYPPQVRFAFGVFVITGMQNINDVPVSWNRFMYYPDNYKDEALKKPGASIKSKNPFVQIEVLN